MPKFRITFVADLEVELDQAVIDQVTDEWRSMFYQLYTPEDIAGHIGYNLAFNRAPLTMLDGWADLEDSMAQAQWVWDEIEQETIVRIKKED